MSKSQWSVEMRVEKHVTVTVEADTQAEAIQKAKDFDVIAQQDGDTINWRVISATQD